MPLMNPSLASMRRSALRFLDGSVSRVMGCFLSCFRVREDDRPRRSRAFRRESSSDTILSPNLLSSIFQYEAIPNLHGYERTAKETKETPWKNQEDHASRLGFPCTINEELIDQAKFLKACGTIDETPTEIQKAVKRLMVSPPIKSDKQPEVPPTSSELCRNSTEDVDSLDHTPCSCISDVQNTGTRSVGFSEGSAKGTNGMLPKHPKAETDMVTPFLHRVSASDDAPSRQKSVRFELDTDRYSTRATRQLLNISEQLEDDTVTEPSPYPTPLKLSDEMQTPGTVFAANMESVFHGKGRIRSQYVYPDPVQNEYEPRQNPEMRPQDTAGEEELGVEASYSAWLKRPYEQQDETDTGYVAFPGRRTEPYGTPGDRPIIGLVAAHWNEDDECGNRSAKCWDGNGIPNTTNKYKEDQRVTWHATPFEERLEKALSEERFVSQKGQL